MAIEYSLPNLKKKIPPACTLSLYVFYDNGDTL